MNSAQWVDNSSNASFEVVLSKDVIMHLYKFRQNFLWNKEAGGQLFGQLEGKKMLVNIATGPRKSDKRSRYNYLPNRKEEQKEIDEQLENNFIYLGDWHTHPESYPEPSDLDIETSNDCFSKSIHAMPGYLMMIVSKSRYVDSWYVGITSPVGTRKLQPLKMG